MLDKEFARFTIRATQIWRHKRTKSVAHLNVRHHYAMGNIKDIVDLAIELEGRAKDRKDIETLRSIISLTQAVQSSEAEIVERDIRVMQENAQLVRDKAELERQLTQAQAEEIRIHRAIEFRRGARTGGKWAAFCPKCHMPALEYADHTWIQCSTGCGWGAPIEVSLESFISQL